MITLPAPDPILERIAPAMITYPGRMVDHYRTNARTYARALSAAWDARPEIAASLTDYRDPRSLPIGARPYLSPDRLSGFVITADAEIIGLWSAAPGRGDALVRAAIFTGGRRLDCFAGYLSDSLYYRHGFVVVDRQPNHTPGGPDVVWMEYRPVI
jgi:hypothetical protein